jgi:hypothetical protein
MDRTALVGEIGREITITFGPDERIGRVVFGQPEAELWLGPDPKEAQAVRNNLPLWPMKVGRTNMQVTTTLPDGSQRIYQFALVAKTPDSDGGDDPDVTFGLIFTYPQQEKQQEALTTWKARKDAADKTLAKDRLKVDIFYGERNWSYVARPNKDWIAHAWPREHAILWGSLRRQCDSLIVVRRAEAGIAMTEGVLERIVQHRCSHVEEGLHGRSVPAHLLFLVHALGDDLVDRTLHERGRDRFAIPAPGGVMDQRSLVSFEVGQQFADVVCQAPDASHAAYRCAPRPAA